ncbi:transcriptional regulator [Streptomyces sp. H27-S2]|uniref:transcriptional regulator n=1 Tax=Streptomyces antarcticus TaxID=2996458 RepID=UPI00226FD785|nr:transcriptional regulator [Streptomyces sp. H27-S2]MCY0948366.1 transcriptional regulator [Streptomyces sp. H27-S2]
MIREHPPEQVVPGPPGVPERQVLRVRLFFVSAGLGSTAVGDAERLVGHPAFRGDLLAVARERIDVLVYAAVFLHEAYPRLNDLLRERAADGCAVRIAVGDADSENVQQRGQEEKFGHGIESRCRLALLHYRPLASVPGIELRTHGTTLYNSLYRADDQVLVNAHAWGVNAYGAPVWHLRRHESGGMFDTYADSFDAVWETAHPVEA